MSEVVTWEAIEQALAAFYAGHEARHPSPPESFYTPLSGAIRPSKPPAPPVTVEALRALLEAPHRVEDTSNPADFLKAEELNG